MIPSLPATIAPAAPFPHTISQRREEEFVAPGVRRASYHLRTADGPLTFQVIAVDLHEPSVRVDTVVANDRMISGGETLTSMARRSGAIAGVNADYFDIGQTNQPLNLVVRHGALERTPSRRVIFDVRRDRSAHIERASFSGTATYNGTRIPWTTVNEWPPQGGAGYLDASYGTLRPLPGVQVATLVPAAVSHDVATPDGTYRVVSVDSAQTLAANAGVAGPLLAFGPAALALASPPAAGDDVTLESSLLPPLGDVVCALGGGPQLLAGGAPVEDPFAPAPEERQVRFPVSGVGITPDGGVLLASVDGHQSALSIGLTRPQFAALWQALGASDAMAFDSGGSSELAGRVLGEPDAGVMGSPSDGEERRIADGLFIYSDAPPGPPARLVARPSAVVALPAVPVPLRLTLTDAAGHYLGAATPPQVLVTPAASGPLTVRANGLSATVPVDIVKQPALLAIAGADADPDPHGDVALSLSAYDQNGREIALGDAVRWSASGGTFTAPGRLHVGNRDVRVTASVAGITTQAVVAVGRHDVALTLFAGDELQLPYDFSKGTRFAYAATDAVLPAGAVSFSIAAVGDGSGVGLRAAFVNRFGERRALTLARTVDWRGPRVLTIALPADLTPPVRVVSLYAVDGLGGAATHANGTLAFRAPAATVAGTP